MLPKGPKWMCKPLATVHPTKKPVNLFYRDGIECVESLLNNPLLADHISFTPLQVFKNAEKLVRIYSEWRTGLAAWEMQVSSKVLVIM
jgi:hypothetical protein